jgi:hypothetical protein
MRHTSYFCTPWQARMSAQEIRHVTDGLAGLVCYAPSTMASDCAGTPCGGAAAPPRPDAGVVEQYPQGTMLAGRANHADRGRRTFIPVSVRQDRAVRMQERRRLLARQLQGGDARLQACCKAGFLQSMAESGVATRFEALSSVGKAAKEVAPCYPR